MSETQTESRETDMGEKSRHYALLLLLFSASGCAALIYEVVWYQLLQLAIGSTSVSLGILLATFMGGLCIGSLVAAAAAATRQHPLRVYAALEFGHRRLRDPGAVRPCLSESRVYQRRGAWSAGNAAARGAGRDLHAAADDPDGRVAADDRPLDQEHAGRGFLVGISLRRQHGGRGFGCLVAGFYLLRIYDMATATWCAAAINIAVAVAACCWRGALLRLTTAQSDLPTGETEFPDSAEAAGPST